MKYHSALTRMAVKMTDNPKCLWECRATRILNSCKIITSLEKDMTISHKTKCLLSYNPAIPFLNIYPREMKTYVYTKSCTWMFIAALMYNSEEEEISIGQLIIADVNW